MLQNRELLPQRQIFEEQLTARATGSDNYNERRPQQAQHERILARATAIHLSDSKVDRNSGEAKVYSSRDRSSIPEIVRIHFP
jgi:hypothetical protein